MAFAGSIFRHTVAVLTHHIMLVVMVIDSQRTTFKGFLSREMPLTVAKKPTNGTEEATLAKCILLQIFKCSAQAADCPAPLHLAA